MTDFVHLRTHSHYSLLTAPARVSALVAAAQADQQTALGLTDNGNLFGAIEFYKACKDTDLESVLGMVAYAAGRSRREPSGAANPTSQLTLLAVDATGWDHLKRLSSLSHLEGFHYRPRIDREALSEHAGGLVVLSGDLSGEIGRALQAGDTKTACDVAVELRDIVGKGNFYLEIQDTGLDAQKRVNPQLVEMHQRLDIPLCATNDVHYIKKADWVAQDIMTCIRSGRAISDPDRVRMPTRELYFKSRAQMAKLFKDLPQALQSTVEIAERASVEIDMSTYHLPVFETGSDESADEMFVRVCYEGARERYGEITREIEQRLEYEIGIIRQLGFASYFLITMDFIEYARRAGIPVGPGRGSAAGSIVAYCMKITNLDPLRYNLLFERFLNASRVSMPDIDVDFCGNRRDEVIDYVRQRYGEECVSQIITFGTMASRGVLRDVGRVLEVPLGDVDKICKKVPQGPGASLQAALETDTELQQIRDESTESKRLFDLGLKLEGMARHSSVHAAGVVVGDRPLRDYVPLCKNGDDTVTQWQMTELEEVGLLKVDFLGLKTLTILTECVRLVKDTRGIDIDLDQVPLDDAGTYALVTRGETLGVFQLESGGMRELLTRLKPDVFEDLIAVLALYRPGPLGSGMVDMFVRRKHGEEEVEYAHESLQPILEETYGVITYQEQVMRTANVFAGFSMNDADTLRKAMGKKKPEVMEKFKDQFVEGAVEKGHDRKMSRELFEMIEYFAGYGFNKSHSAAYALVTYHTAYLKAHYPVEFFAANMTVESGSSDKLKEFVDEARRIGRSVRPPDVNSSECHFSVEEEHLRYGLGAIKGVGTRLAEETAAERRRNGPYKSLENYCSRLDPTVLNRGAIEVLVKAGAFDAVEPTRKSATEGIDAAMRASAVARDDRRKGQGLLFDFDDSPPPTLEKPSKQSEWSEMERLTREKEALGFFLSGHPFEKRGKFFARIAGHTSADLAKLEHGEEVCVAGMIAGARIVSVRQGRNAGKKMARFQLEDLEGVVSCVVFARQYESVKDVIADDEIVFARGTVDKRDDELGMLVNEVRRASTVVRDQVDAIVVHLRAGGDQDRELERIQAVAGEHKGEQRLIFEIEDGERTYRVHADRRFSVTVSEDLLDELVSVVGTANLSFTRR